MHSAKNRSIDELRESIRIFTKERDWARYHSPKNLAMALIAEAAEIVEIFQWLTPGESETLKGTKLQHLREEIGDVLIYLINLSDHCGIDPIEAAFEKMRINADKYPPELVRGKSDKYTEY
jgi:dCTP diphosphatase